MWRAHWDTFHDTVNNLLLPDKEKHKLSVWCDVMWCEGEKIFLHGLVWKALNWISKTFLLKEFCVLFLLISSNTRCIHRCIHRCIRYVMSLNLFPKQTHINKEQQLCDEEEISETNESKLHLLSLFLWTSLCSSLLPGPAFYWKTENALLLFCDRSSASGDFCQIKHFKPLKNPNLQLTCQRLASHWNDFNAINN